ncbi:phage tail sheath subtilisin-like domain-containing protein [Rhodoferax sp. BLA1]|uniref:phage tail sheath subtilisin-like domain-containing protein n=1 Tax=Rhodoferax sp. BLA1 TaxID=2576062 RepID=UPI0015D431C5|nr:phage tail sheath subtilisin-like domain-containing protein [Rhodoferax sp. BLA1]
MSVSFDNIPSALRYPGAYIEIDGSAAGLSGGLGSVLIVGQKLAAGTAPAGEITLVSSVQDAKTKAGAGSMLARMVSRYRAIDQALDVYMLPYADNVAGVAATGTLVATAVPSEAGTLGLYIGGDLVSVGITAGMATTAVAAAIAAAITASTLDLPVTAAVTASTVTLTARHKGTCGNGIDLRTNLYGERTPAGLGLTINAMTGGTGDPAPGALTSIIGQRWYNYVALGMNDQATLAAWHTESVLRYRPPVQAGFRAFAAMRGDYAAAVAFGATGNYEHISTLALGINPVSHWEAAAIVAAAAAPKLRNNPVESLEGRTLTGLVGVSYFDWTQANSLLYKGMSVLQMTQDGTCSVKRLISMYQYRPDGSADDAYLDINAAEVMERIRYEQRIGAIQRFTGTAAAKTNEGYRPGLRITTEADVRAYLLSLYQFTLMREKGWCQAYDYYKSTLVVEQDPTNPSRFNYVDQPVVLSPFYILAGRAKFRKAVPVA